MRPSIARLIFRFEDRRAGLGMLPAFRDLSQTQWLSTEQLQALSWNRFTTLLHYAYANVPYYRDAFDRMHIKPEHIKSTVDLVKLPVLTKGAVQKEVQYLEPVRNIPRSRPDGTSGSTGNPVTFRVDANARAHFLAAKMRGESWYGVKYGDAVARIWSLPLSRRPRVREKIKDKLLNRVRLSQFEMSDLAMEEFARRCSRFRPALLYGYATSTAKFARFVLDHNLQECFSSLRAVATTCEALRDNHRAMIEQAFSLPVASEYGCTETGVIAYQCPEGAFHVAVENVLVEVVDEDWQPVSVGRPGTILVTGLHNRATPFIRYVLGDYGALEPGNCKCGRGLPLMSPMIGRTADSLRRRDGTYMPGWIFDYIVRKVTARGGGIHGFRVTQTALDEFKVELIPSATFGPHVKENIAREIERQLGFGLSICFETQSELKPEANGKLRCFVPLSEDGQKQYVQENTIVAP